MAQSTLTNLIEQAKVVFLASLEGYQGEFGHPISEADALNTISNEIGRAIDTVLDEKSDAYTQTLLLCCLEDTDLFTREPDNTSCIDQNGEPGQVNAQHCVYHNVYNRLQSILEHEFDEWNNR